MQDLERQIASRKLRLQEMRRQHEARVRQRESGNSVCVFETPILDVAVAESEPAVSEPEHDIAEVPSGTNGEWSIELASHLDAQLKTFIDDAMRCVARSLPQTQVNLFRTPDSDQKPQQLNFELEWQLDLPITSRSLAFSPHFTSLAAAISADGSNISLWSLDAPENPEYTLVGAQKLVQCVFSKTNANHLFCANEYGQVFKYDLQSDVFGGRFNLWPQIRSKEVGSGQIVGLQFVSPNFLVSLHEDHKACLWSSDVLSEPVHLINLQFANRAVDIVPTCMALTPSVLCTSFGIGLCVVGTLDGFLFQLPGSSDEISDFASAHKSPVACLAFRPPNDASGELPAHDILASSGYDYSLKLWFVANASDSRCRFKLLATLPVSSTVRAMQWHPTEPGVLVVGLNKKLEVWNLSRSLVAPVFSVPVNALNPSISINLDGTKVLVANAGKCSCYRLPQLKSNDRWVSTNLFK